MPPEAHGPAQARSARFCRALLFGLGLSIAAQATLAQEQRIDFDIPAQPLDAALSYYGDATGREALYDTSLADGRTSGSVQGLLTPNEALRKLLTGTGLFARFVAERSFVLLPAPPASLQARQPQTPAHRHYYGLIQGSLLEALCRSRHAHPGSYRIAVALWIDPSGRIDRSERIGSAGADDIDRQIDVTLRSVQFSEPPPADLAQPVVILLVPQARGVTPGCGGADSHAVPARTPSLVAP